MEEEKAGLAKWALDNNEVILTFQHILQGEQIVPYKRTDTLLDGSTQDIEDFRWEKTSEPMLNNTGIQRVTTMLYSIANKNTYLSNLEKKEAFALAQDSLLTINKELYLSAENVGLTPENYELIITELMDGVIPALLRPYDEGERRFYAKTTQEYRQITQPETPKAAGGLFSGRV